MGRVRASGRDEGHVKDADLRARLRIESLHEGLCAQIMHVASIQEDRQPVAVVRVHQCEEQHEVED